MVPVPTAAAESLQNGVIIFYTFLRTTATTTTASSDVE